MLHVAVPFWDANEHSHPLSRCFDERWVERLYRSFARNLTVPFRFVVFTERQREFSEPISQERLAAEVPNYGSCIEPYRLGEPMILVGLDTIVVGNIDHFADYCMHADKIALPRDPKSVRLKDKGYPNQSINGVQFVPKGWRKVHDEWNGDNDMVHLRKYPWECIDDRWPGQVVSYKNRIRPAGEFLDKARIVYFHGQPKAHELTHIAWVKEHWR